MNSITPFGWKRNLGYIYQGILLVLKETKEYKASIYSATLIQLVYYLVYTLFFYIMAINFSDIIIWKIEDYILYFLFIGVVADMGGVMFWRNQLFFVLRNGYFNSLLPKPINPFLKKFIGGIAPYGIIFMCISIILIPFVIWIFKIKFETFLLPIIIISLLVILMSSLFLFIESIEFIQLKLSEVFHFPIKNLININEMYPAPYFLDTKLRFGFLFVPFFYVGSLVIPLFRGYPVWNLQFQIISIIFFITLFILGIIVNWHYGLKRYEAFG